MLDSNLIRTSSAKAAVYSATLTKKNNLWEAAIFYKNGKLAGTGNYRNRKLTIKDGKLIGYHEANGQKKYEHIYENGIAHGSSQSWYENGQKKDSGTMFDGKKTGFWRFWYFNGKLSSEGYYTDYQAIPIPFLYRLPEKERRKFRVQQLALLPETKSGTWVSWHENGQVKDSATYDASGFLNGPQKTWYGNGQLESAGEYNKNRPHGTWQWFYSNGHKATVEEYLNGRIFGLLCFDTLGNNTGIACSINRMPVFPGGTVAYEQFIERNLQYPVVPGKPKGYVELRLNIDAKGKPEIIQVIQSNHDYFTREAKRLVSIMPAWEPAIAHNKPVPMEMTVWCTFTPPKRGK